LPWIYDAGIEAINTLRAPYGEDEKLDAIQKFSRIVDFSFEHPVMRDSYGETKEIQYFFRRLPDMFMRALERDR
jgi:hypothetical protein